MVLCSGLTMVSSPHVSDPRHSLPQSHIGSAVWLAHLDLHFTAPRHTLLQALSSMLITKTLLDSSGSLTFKLQTLAQCLPQCLSSCSFCLKSDQHAIDVINRALNCSCNKSNSVVTRFLAMEEKHSFQYSF